MALGYFLHSGDVMKFCQVAFSYMMDIVSLSAPVCLFIASDTVRMAYYQFYFRRKKVASASIIRVQTAQFKGF
ncbi:hypothetical protein AAVH_43482 [Aphelenchoides avenae]|nr:hypothetical protein AAVH_43482 [Aphelenchus avenae]